MTQEQFLSDTDQRLRSRLPDSVRETRIRELKSHLDLARQDLVSTGVDRATAEAQSVANMGSSGVVANEIIRQYRGIATSSAWRLSLSVVPALALAVFGPLLAFWLLPYGVAKHAHSLCMCVAILAFTFKVWRTRRWLVVPAACWYSAMGLVQLLAVLAIYPNLAVPLGAGLYDPATTRSELVSLTRDKIAIAKWREGHPPTDLGPYELFERRSEPLPLVPFQIPLPSESKISLMSMSAFESGQAWANLGDAYANGIADKERELTYRLIDPPDYRVRSPYGLWHTAIWKLGNFLLSALVLALYNGLALLLARASMQTSNNHARGRTA